MSGGDSYRPAYNADRYNRPPDHRNREQLPPPPLPSWGHNAPPPPRSNNDMFHFKGAAGADNHRSYDTRRDGHADTYRPHNYERPDSFWAPPNDEYPSQYQGGANRQNDFDFRPQNNYDAPSFPPARPQGRHEKRRDAGRGRGGVRGRGGRGGRGGAKASDRALFRAHRSPTPEQLAGMNMGQSKFKELTDLSDSAEEDDMDKGRSDDYARGAKNRNRAQTVDPAINIDSDEDEHPRAKRARVGKADDAEAREVPRWSNPDPYTALPPPGESLAKGKDVLKLIRKAKVDGARGNDSKGASDDFISLNFDDPDGSSSPGITERSSLSVHPTPFSHLDNLHPDRTVPTSVSDSGRTGRSTRTMEAGKVDTWPNPSTEIEPRRQVQNAVAKQDATASASKPGRAVNRKRKMPTRDTGSINDAWEVVDQNIDPVPWLVEATGERKDADLIMSRLHREIIDFYDFVKPRPFENGVRNNLISRINIAFRNVHPNVSVLAFGSFASGLYLPTADMDLVAVTSSFLSTGIASLPYGTYGAMKRISAELERAGLIRQGSLTCIPKARVPIIKFVEQVTGLRVDISFENNSGLKANNTFTVWKERYPAMPWIVALIKQFLAMRDLSEVVNGGLGGYSIICLVVCTIHFLEQKNGPDWSARGHLDQVLLTFLDHYGSKFNLALLGLDMKRMAYINKDSFNGRRSKPGRLLIVDPNNPDNDISGGSGAIREIFDRFGNAHENLRDRMDAVQTGISDGDHLRGSILGAVWGGNYESFQIQRARLSELSEQGYSEAPSEPDAEVEQMVENMQITFKKPKPKKTEHQREAMLRRRKLIREQRKQSGVKQASNQASVEQSDVDRAAFLKKKHPKLNVPSSISKQEYKKMKRDLQS